MLLEFGKLLFILFALHLGALVISAQSTLISKEFLKIVPGVTTKQEIEKRFGTVELANDFMADYQTEKFSMTVEYATSDCDAGNVPWALPKDMVEMITYWLPEEEKRSLAGVILKRSKFTAKYEGDVGEHLTYRNRDHGIAVVYDTELKVVRAVTLEPTTDQMKQFACKNYNK